MEDFTDPFQHLKIRLEDIKSATNDFNETNIIGRGGFGKVYKGVLVSPSNPQSVAAFKRLNRINGQGEHEFWTEIKALSRYTHENLISLLGYCDEDGEQILVYEYASHGSLDSHLSSTTLTWEQRLNICIGAANGLSYLHDPRETHQRVFHRDIKSSNILLDEHWNAKVSDMGLSKLGIASEENSFLVSHMVGSIGYVDPMYAQRGILTKESDVYSFGVVLFEVLCGRLCYGVDNGHLQILVPRWKRNYKDKTLNNAIFEGLAQHMDRRSMETFSDIAYHCVKKSPRKRPTMYQVVEKLQISLRYQQMGNSNTLVPRLLYKSKEVITKLLNSPNIGTYVLGPALYVGCYYIKSKVTSNGARIDPNSLVRRYYKETGDHEMRKSIDRIFKIK